VLPQQQQAAASPQLVPLLTGLLCTAGLSWSSWLAVVQLAAALTAAAAAAAAAGSSTVGGAAVQQQQYVASLVPLAGGLAHVLQHSTVSQVSFTHTHTSTVGDIACWFKCRV
jgi:hypothetical protein